MAGDADLPQQDAEAILNLLGEVQDDLYPATGEGEGVGSRFVIGVYTERAASSTGSTFYCRNVCPRRPTWMHG